ncbi:MAG TPA: phosphomannomutase/phosphoglucomutase, partial [Noviherbaspirillum sp.]
MNTLSHAIFKAYDIRGIVGKTLDEEVARQIGLAFGAAARGKGERSVAIGRDGRL